MKKIILSADSTCDLGDELKEKYQVHYYPFHIILEGGLPGQCRHYPGRHLSEIL